MVSVRRIRYQVKQGAGDRDITAENMEKSQHTDFNEYTTNESASVACGNVRLWKLDTQQEWRKTSWRLWDERAEKHFCGFRGQQSEDTKKLPRERGNARNNARCTHRQGRPRTACSSRDVVWMDNVNTWTGLSVEESIRMTEDRDKWSKYGVANPLIEDG